MTAAGITLALAVAAALVDLGNLHRLEHGDSIVPVLVSLQRWTPFYWEQERYGMLVPLLAMPVRDPFWNLLLQRFLLAAAGLGAIGLLARYALARRHWPVAASLAAAMLLAAAPRPWVFEYLFNQPYGLSLALATAGLTVSEPVGRRRSWIRLTSGGVLVAAAHWVNAATGIVLLPLAFARAAVHRAERDARSAVRARLVREGTLLAAGLAAGQILLHLAVRLPDQPLRFRMAPLAASALPAAWSSLLANAWRGAGEWRAVLAASALVGTAALLALAPLKPHARSALLRSGALLAAALVYALFAGSLRWVGENAFHWRYLAPSALLVHLGAVSLLAEPLARLLRAARPAGLAALALVPAAALGSAGPPSLARVRADLGASAGRLTPDVVAARCDLVAGAYWSVWPAVFHASLVLRERGEVRRVWGVSHRAGATVPQWWERRSALRICRPRGEDAEAEHWLRSDHLWPVRLIERRDTVDVLVPAPPFE